MAGFLMSVGKPGEVAERSPTVISANMKEDMLLQKKLVVLNRSERGLVHQIKVDQKVLYKRFQARLVRSKLGFARIMGHKDVEKELRSKNLCGLNTDIVGNSDEDYAFLEKLEHRPCTASSYSPCITPPPKSTPRPKPESVSSQMEEDIPKSSLRIRQPVRSNSATLRTKNAGAETDADKSVERAENNASRGKKFKEMRPATSTGTRVEEEHFPHQNQLPESITSDKTESKQSTPRSKESISQKSYAESELHEEASVPEKNVDTGVTGVMDHLDNAATDGHHDATRENCRVPTTANDSGPQKPSVAFWEQLEIPLQRPRTVAVLGTPDESPPISPKQYSRRASKAADFFQEEKKIDMVEVRLKAARAIDHTEQVEKFCKELESLECSMNKPNVDYYTLRLETSMKQGVDKDVLNVPGTPEDENKRAMGNIYVRSLTFPHLDWNFE